MAAPRSLMLSARVSVRILDAAFSNLHARPHDCFAHRVSAHQSRPMPSCLSLPYGAATPPSTALCSSRARPLAVGSNGICSHVWLAHRASMLSHAAPILRIQQRSSSSTAVTESGPASPETVRYTIGLFHTINSPKWGVMEYAMKNIPIQKVKPLGEESLYEILTEQGKFMLGSLVLLIEKLRKHGYTFQNLTLSALRVDEYGSFVIADQILLEKVTVHGIARAYSRASVILENVCQAFGGHSGEEFQHYLSLMKSLEPLPYMLLVHPVLLPLQARTRAFIDAYDLVMYSLTDNQRQQILAGLIKLNKGWPDIIKNDYLAKWFSNDDSKSFDSKRPENLLTNLRNIELQPFAYQKDLGYYTKNQLRILIACKVPMLIATMYWQLHEIGQFHNIKGETYFCLPGMTCCPLGFCLRREIRMSIPQKEAMFEDDDAPPVEP